MKEVPWGLEKTPMPASGSEAGATAVALPVHWTAWPPLPVRRASSGASRSTCRRRETGVWTVSHDSMSNDGPDPSADRTIHIDQYTGNVLADVDFDAYSAYAKAMAYGIAFHEGDMGDVEPCPERGLLPVGDLPVGLRRRDVVDPPAERSRAAGRAAAAGRPADVERGGLLGLLVSLAFPLVGLTLLAVLALDLLVLSRLPGLRRALS